MAVLTESEIQIIHDHHESLGIADLVKKVKRGYPLVKQYMDSKGLKSMKRAPHDIDHPFRRANRRLEAVVIERKIQNRTYNPK